MKRVPATWLFLFLAFAVCASAGEQDLLLSVPFTGSAEAKVATGSPKAVVSGKPSFVPDKERPGMFIEPGVVVSYEASGNFNPDEGTVLLWFKPNWDSGDGKSHTFFKVYGKGMGLRLTKGYTDTQASNFLYLLYGPGYWNVKVDDDAGRFFQKDRWVHLAGTWSITDQKMNLYVNGALKATERLEGDRPAGEKIFVGSDDGYASFAGGVIADLRIYRRVLSPAEILEIIGKP